MRHWKTIPLAVLCAASLMLSHRANAAADLSSPKKAALSFAKAVEAGDAAAIKEASVNGTDDDYKTIKNLSEMVGAMKKFREAAVKKYGDDAKQFPDLSTMLSSQMEAAEEKVDGDTATIVNKDRPEDKHPMTLKKEGSDWKVDLKQMSSSPEFAKMKEGAARAAPAIDAVTKDVESGKHATFLEAMQAFGQAMRALEPQKE